MSEAHPRRTRSDGERSRGAILREAARLATVEGINGLSIARLADAVGMSKSGLFAHFGSKEELQLATVDHAAAVFAEQVTEPAAAAPTGIGRLRALVETFLDHVESDVYPGGCFFASLTAELDTGSGAVRDQVLEVEYDFIDRIEQAVRDAQSDGDIAIGEDTDQLTFEVNAYLLLANAQYVLSHEREPLDRARKAFENRIGERPLQDSNLEPVG